MDKNKAILALQRYKNAYTEAATKISAIRGDRDLTAEAKARRINDVLVKNDFGKYRAEASEALKALQTNARAKHKNDIVKGLAAADEIALIKDAIKDNAFSADMLKGIIDIYSDRPVCLEAIRGALNNSQNESVRTLALEIPADQTEKQIISINKAISNIENVPPLDASADDFGAAMWRSGASFDSMIDFVNGIGE